MRVRLYGKTHHLRALLIIRTPCTVPFMRRIAGRHEINRIQMELLLRTLRKDQMTHVNRIEGTSHDPRTDSFLRFLRLHFPAALLGSTIFRSSPMPSLYNTIFLPIISTT